MAQPIDYNTLYASTLPAGSPQYLQPSYVGSITPGSTPAASSSGGGLGSLFSGFFDLLKPAVQAGAVIAVTDALQGGRTPNAASAQQNPAVSNGVPVVVSNSGGIATAQLQSLLPWLLIGGVVLVGVAALRK